MARINFEDNVESQDEFWALIQIIGGDRDKALGKLVRFFRIAQEAYGYDIPMDEQHLRNKDFGDMISSGWAVPVDGGFHAFGAEKHFSWYRQKIEAGKKGGRPKSAKATLSPANRASDLANPPAPAPAPAPAQNNTNTGGVDGLTECLGEYQGTLDHFKIGGDPRLAAPQILSLIKRYGFENVRMAIIGARHEAKTATWDPASCFSSTRLADARQFEKFVNLGRKALNKVSVAEAKRVEKEAPQEEEPKADPERVRALIAGIFNKG